MSTGTDLSLILCQNCHEVNTRNAQLCSCCGARLSPRIKNSFARCWALTVTSALLYIPANILPIMTVSKLDRGTPDTIISGIIELIDSGMIPIAILVFTASILVPLLKLSGMFWLLSISHCSQPATVQQMQLFRLINWIGRWSMLDIFIIAVLVSLVQFGVLGEVTAGPGAYAFSAVVVMTMLATHSFDPRLLWDKTQKKEKPHGR